MSGNSSAMRHRVEVTAGIAQVTMDHPEAMNAMRTTDFIALTEAVAALDEQPDVRVIALTGAGHAFCAGADLGSPGSQVDLDTLDAAAGLVRTVVTSTTSVVALVNGPAAGAGCSLALAADYTLAHEDAFFALTFGQIGLMPDAGATALVTASVGRARALRMALTGERVSADTAARWGLVAETSSADAFAERGRSLLRALATSSMPALAATASAINTAAGDLDAALQRERAGQELLLRGADFGEGVAAFVEKRTPRFSSSAPRL